MIYAYCIESYLLDLVDRKNGFQTVHHELNFMVLTSIKRNNINWEILEYIIYETFTPAQISMSLFMLYNVIFNFELCQKNC